MRTLAILLFALLTLPGCVAWEIRDEIRSTNSQLGGVHTSLSDTNQRLDKVDSGLGRIDATNSSLDTLQQQLELLASIKESLTRLDTHLGSLRKTIGRIDNAIPFLDLGSDAPVEEPAAAASADGAPTAPETADAPSPVRRDPLIGTWMLVGGEHPYLFVLNQDGRALIGTPSTISRGTWTREGAQLRFQGAPVEAKQADGKTQVTTPPPEVFVIAAQTARSLTLEWRGGLRVFNKP